MKAVSLIASALLVAAVNAFAPTSVFTGQTAAFARSANLNQGSVSQLSMAMERTYIMVRDCCRSIIFKNIVRDGR